MQWSSDGFHLVVADFLDELNHPKASEVSKMLRGEQPEQRLIYPPPLPIDANQQSFTCIGGQCDGRRVPASFERSQIQMMVAPVAELYWNDTRAPIGTEVYQRERLNAGDVRFTWFRHAGMSVPQSLQHLLENYPTDQELLERRMRERKR